MSKLKFKVGDRVCRDGWPGWEITKYHGYGLYSGKYVGRFNMSGWFMFFPTRRLSFDAKGVAHGQRD